MFLELKSNMVWGSESSACISYIISSIIYHRLCYRIFIRVYISYFSSFIVSDCGLIVY